MSSSTRTPKSILKKKKSSSASSSTTGIRTPPTKPHTPPYPPSVTDMPFPGTIIRARRTDAELREIALHHANLIQQRKDLEILILGSIELLLDFPTTGQPASNPSTNDITVFRKNLIHFRPSDYEDLIEERNISNKCGYALCPLPKQKESKSRLRVLDQGRKIVEAKSLERFCGDECARRGLWIKVQLNSEPAWQRVGEDGEVGMGGVEYRITLMEEEKTGAVEVTDKKALEGSVGKLAEELGVMGIRDPGIVVLPLERDMVRISEKPPQVAHRVPAVAPNETGLESSMAALAVEGFVPKEVQKGEN